MMLDRAAAVHPGKAASGSFGLHGWLLAIWFAVSFGVVFFARDLQVVVAGWPLDYWFVAQGSVFVFIAIVAIFAWVVNRREAEDSDVDIERSEERRVGKECRSRWS